MIYQSIAAGLEVGLIFLLAYPVASLVGVCKRDRLPVCAVGALMTILF